MSEKITIDREVVESMQKRLTAALDEPRETMSDAKALREIVRQLRLMRDELSTALAACEARLEPVAWMFQHGETGRWAYQANDGINKPELFAALNPRYGPAVPLFAAPPPPAVEAQPVADMPAVVQVPQGLIEAVDRVLEEAHCDCPQRLRFDDGQHLSGCPLFDLNVARLAMLAAAPPQPAACPHIRSSGTGDHATNWCALNGPPPAEPSDAMPTEFADWLAREMPPYTVIGDPGWWAPRIWRAALVSARGVRNG